MLSHLDCIIFPDRCEVIEVIPSQRYVYPIFKNGQSSLLTATKQNNWNIFLNEKIKKINSIDVFVRNPVERLTSGISSFILTTIRDHPDLDVNTVNWFAENYLYLNRHYAPQFLWLVNLARYTHIECVLNFLEISDIKTVTDVHERPFKKIPVNTHIANNEMYQRIDQVLMDSVGSSMTFAQLVKQIQHKDKHAYEWVIGRSQRILKPTYALS